MQKQLLLTITAFVFLAACKDEENNFNPLETGFVSHWSFNGSLTDGTQFSTVLDSCDAPSYGPGVSQQALLLDDQCRRITFDKTTFRNGQKISVSLWFNTSENGNIRYFIKSDDFSFFTAHGAAGMAISTPNTNSAKGAFLLGQWNHLVGTYDGTTIKTYINGQLAASTKHKGEIAGTGQSLILDGGGPASGTLSTWTGAIDELYIFDAVLSEEQVQKLYAM